MPLVDQPLAVIDPDPCAGHDGRIRRSAARVSKFVKTRYEMGLIG
jgi:hypothetical protein